MENIHTREYPVSPEAVRGWLQHAWSGTDQDVFPRDLVPSWRKGGPLQVGMVMGHGPFSFRLCQWDEQNLRVEFRGNGVRGWHGFEWTARADSTVVTHRLKMGGNPIALALARIFVWPVHDWAVESLLDRLGSALETGTVPVFTTRPLTGMARWIWQMANPRAAHNTHFRDFPHPITQVAGWMDQLGTATEKDAFPRELFPNHHDSDGLLIPGVTRMGHGPIRYRFLKWDGRNWEASFLHRRLTGHHGFVLTPVNGGTRLSHVLTARLSGSVLLKWPILIRPLHNRVIETLFDRLQTGLTTGKLETLPYVDEHAVDLAAGVEDVWPALLKTLDRTFSRPGASGYARMVGCADCKVSGPRPLAVGSQLTGFHVVTADPESTLVMEGRHRFSSYAVKFRLEALGKGRSRLLAETRAAFPGLSGQLYRLLVIGTGMHALVVGQMLAGIKRAAGQEVRRR